METNETVVEETTHYFIQESGLMNWATENLFALAIFTIVPTVLIFLILGAVLTRNYGRADTAVEREAGIVERRKFITQGFIAAVLVGVIGISINYGLYHFIGKRDLENQVLRTITAYQVVPDGKQKERMVADMLRHPSGTFAIKGQPVAGEKTETTMLYFKSVDGGWEVSLTDLSEDEGS